MRNSFSQWNIISVYNEEIRHTLQTAFSFHFVFVFDVRICNWYFLYGFPWWLCILHDGKHLLCCLTNRKRNYLEISTSREVEIRWHRQQHWQCNSIILIHMYSKTLFKVCHWMLIENEQISTKMASNNKKTFDFIYSISHLSHHSDTYSKPTAWTFAYSRPQYF